jgi:outer membrane protein assembly factor BamB
MFRYNAQHAGRCPYDTSRNVGALKWKYKPDAQTKSSPAIAPDGTVYVGSWDSFLCALDPVGAVKWRYETETRIASSPAIALDGTI